MQTVQTWRAEVMGWHVEHFEVEPQRLKEVSLMLQHFVLHCGRLVRVTRSERKQLRLNEDITHTSHTHTHTQMHGESELLWSCVHTRAL